MKFSIDSTATRAATSPAACPPIPSATTNSRRSSALMKQSSFMRRTGPVSVRPNAFKRGSSLPRPFEKHTTLVVQATVQPRAITAQTCAIVRSHAKSGELAGQLGARVDADLFEDARQMLFGGGGGDAERDGD